MVARSVLALVVLAAAGPLLAEPLWVRTFDGGPFDPRAPFVVSTTDGGFLLLADDGGSLLKLDALGNALWLRGPEPGADLSVRDHVLAADGTLWLAGASGTPPRGVVARIDPVTGAVLARLRLTCASPGGATVLASIAPMSSGGYLLAGESDCQGSTEPHVYLAEIDGTGSIRWQHVLEITVAGQPGSDGAVGAFPKPAGGILLVGHTTAASGAAPQPVFLDLDDLGQPVRGAVWNGVDVPAPTHAEQLAGGAVRVALGPGYYVVPDTQPWPIPVIIQERFVSGRGRLSPLAGGGYAFSGSLTPSGRVARDATLVELDAQEQILAGRTFGDPIRDVAEEGLAAADAPGGFVTYGREGLTRLIVGRVDAGLDVDTRCTALVPFVPVSGGFFDSPIRPAADARAVTTSEVFETGPTTTVERPILAGELCFRSADCSATMSPVRDVRARRLANDVELSWQQDLAAAGHDVWWVEDARLLDRARLGGVGTGVTGCAPPTPATVPSCLDRGVVDRVPRVFYQVRPYCDPGIEGP